MTTGTATYSINPILGNFPAAQDTELYFWIKSDKPFRAINNELTLTLKFDTGYSDIVWTADESYTSWSRVSVTIPAGYPLIGFVFSASVFCDVCIDDMQFYDEVNGLWEAQYNDMDFEGRTGGTYPNPYAYWSAFTGGAAIDAAAARTGVYGLLFSGVPSVFTLNATRTTISGMPVEILADTKISRGSGDLITSCSFQVSADIIDLCRDYAEVIVKTPVKTVFIGVIFDYQIQYQGRTPILNVNCADFSYRLSHGDMCADFASISGIDLVQCQYFNEDWMLGDAIEYLLAGTGISASRVGARNIECQFYQTVAGDTRMSVIQKLCELSGCMFWIEFDGDLSIAVCDTMQALKTQDRYSIPVAVSDSSHLVESCEVESVPEMNCTRLIVHGV